MEKPGGEVQLDAREKLQTVCANVGNVSKHKEITVAFGDCFWKYCCYVMEKISIEILFVGSDLVALQGCVAHLDGQHALPGKHQLRKPRTVLSFSKSV